MYPRTFFTMLFLSGPLLGCTGSGLKSYGAPSDSVVLDVAIDTSNSALDNAGSHLAVRTYSILPQITKEEQANIFMSALSAIQENPAWVETVLRRRRPFGTIIFTPEGMARYEDNVIKSLTTRAAQQAAKRLPRPWPIWQPSIIWGTPSPPLPPGIGKTG